MLESTDLHQLITKCIHGDSNAQKECYYLYYSLLMNTSMRYVKGREDAEQIVHDSYLKIFTNLNKYIYTNDNQFEAWIKRITINTCIDFLRRNKAFQNTNELNTETQDLESLSKIDYVENDVFKKLSVAYILSLIEKLPEKEKLVFKLHVLEGFEHNDIGEMIGITVNNSYWLLHQARKKLQQSIKQSW